ncbi:MAG: flagellar hook-associated protein FlgL [Gallionella sp.]|nr:flagellar hook-associated protein FlgL [Gallionella sp.]
MRISTGMIYDSNVTTLNQQQAKLMQTQQQLATGRRLLTPSIDPAAAAQALEVSHADATNTQYTTNRDSLKGTLTQMDSTLQGITGVLQDIRTTLVGSNYSTYTDSDRINISNALQSRLDQLVSMANTKNANGNFLFSGFQSKTQPFSNTAAGYAYFGDDGKKLTQISDTLQVGATQSGADIFMRVKNGNGVFVTQATATNTGTGLMNQGSVTNPTALTGNNYSISFTVAAGVTTYNVTNTTTGAAVLTAQPYTAGQTIAFDGMQMTVQGAPANGDQFTLAPSSNVSIFKNIADAIAALKVSVPPGNAAQANALASSISSAIANMDRGLNSISAANTVVGVSMNAVDSAQSMGDNLGLNYKQTLSNLQDTDYNKAATDLAQQQLSLQAAQKSFVQVSNLSLFTYM